jgi:predicted acylesterase/phospholipase RssA
MIQNNTLRGHMADEQGAAPEDRFCDLVMKGGITSGIVYPPAIAKLAREYRFKNIGGTSAGAIAAAVAAAA